MTPSLIALVLRERTPILFYVGLSPLWSLRNGDLSFFPLPAHLILSSLSVKKVYRLIPDRPSPPTHYVSID